MGENISNKDIVVHLSSYLLGALKDIVNDEKELKDMATAIALSLVLGAEHTTHKNRVRDYLN